MGEDWLMQLLTSRWTAAASAYVLGLLTGWAIWGAAKAADRHVEGDLNRESSPENGDALGALEAELEKARALLDDQAEDQKTVLDVVARLEEAIKRANGRLKLIVKSVKNKK